MRHLTIAISASFLALLTPSHAATVSITTVALTGNDAPGGGGVVFDFVSTTGPRINANGEVFFDANLSGPGITGANDNVLISGAAGGLIIAAREGDPAPGGGVLGFPGLGLNINNNGQIAIEGSPFGGANGGAFAGTPGALFQAAQNGAVAPGTGGATFTTIDAVSVNDAGIVGFAAVLSDGREGIFVVDGSVITPVALTGDAVSGVPGATISNIDLFEVSPVSNGGAIAFEADITGGAVTSADNTVLLTAGIGGLAIAAREGDIAPGTGGAIFDSDFEDPDFTDTGELSFLAELETGVAGVTSNSDEVFFISGPGGLTLAAQESDIVPGTADTAIDLILEATANDLGTIVLEALLEGTNITSDNNRALLFDLGSGLETFLQEGDLFDVGGGDLRTIVLLSIAEFASLNDSNQLAFSAVFSDGTSGIFRADLGIAEVPLPAAAWIFLAGLGGLGAMRRRSNLT